MDAQTKLLEEGDIIRLEAGHKVYADIPKHFVYSNCRGVWDLCHHEVVIGGEHDYLTGDYVVYRAYSGGGSTGGGMNGHDDWPDGWHVFAERADGVKVDFYQSGCFTAMIREIQPIGHATRRWVIE